MRRKDRVDYFDWSVIVKKFEMSLEILKLKSLEKRIGSGHAVYSEVKSNYSKDLPDIRANNPSFIIFNNSPKKSTLFSTTYGFKKEIITFRIK